MNHKLLAKLVVRGIPDMGNIGRRRIATWLDDCWYVVRRSLDKEPPGTSGPKGWVVVSGPSRGFFEEKFLERFPTLLRAGTLPTDEFEVAGTPCPLCGHRGFQRKTPPAPAPAVLGGIV